MSHPWLPHLPLTTSTSSSSFPLPSTTQEHAAQSEQQEHLQEHPVHHAHLQAPSVDKLRHQESLWREDLQSGGNPRTTTPSGYEPKELANPYQSYAVQEKVGEEDDRAPITEEVDEFGEIGTACLPDSKIPETSVNDNDKRKSKDWRPDAQYRRIIYEKKVLRNTQIRNMRELVEIKRAQEQRIDEVSVQKLREHHETIQHLTSLLQQMQEQMNSMNDSGDFQDVESNYSGRLSHVSSQLVMIPSSRSLLCRDKRLPLDTWNHFGLQENVLGNQFSTFDSPRDHHQRIQSDDVQRNREAVPEAGRTKTIHTSEDRLNQNTIPCRHLRQSRGLRVLQCGWKLQSFMVGQQR